MRKLLQRVSGAAAGEGLQQDSERGAPTPPGNGRAERVPAARVQLLPGLRLRAVGEKSTVPRFPATDTVVVVTER